MTILKHVDFEVPAWGELSQGPSACLSYAAAVLALGPLAYWRLGGVSGTSARDEAGARDLAHTHAPTLGEPGALARDLDGAVVYDGASQSTSAAGLPPMGIASVVLWFKPAATVTAATPGQVLLGCTSGEFIYSVAIGSYTSFLSGEVLTFRSSANSRSGWAGSGLSLSAGWHFLAAVFNPGVPRWDLYHAEAGVDAAPIQRANTVGGGTPDAVSAADNLYLAREHPAATIPGYFAGALDEVAVFGRALTAAEVTDLYRRGRGTFQLPA